MFDCKNALKIMARLIDYEEIGGALFDNVKSEVRNYASVISILEKIHYDDNFAVLGKTFFDILDFETIYAYTGWFIRAPKAEGCEPGNRHRKPTGREYARVQGQPKTDRGESQCDKKSSTFGERK